MNILTTTCTHVASQERSSKLNLSWKKLVKRIYSSVATSQSIPENTNEILKELYSKGSCKLEPSLFSQALQIETCKDLANYIRATKNPFQAPLWDVTHLKKFRTLTTFFPPPLMMVSAKSRFVLSVVNTDTSFVEKIFESKVIEESYLYSIEIPQTPSILSWKTTPKKSLRIFLKSSRSLELLTTICNFKLISYLKLGELSGDSLFICVDSQSTEEALCSINASHEQG